MKNSFLFLCESLRQGAAFIFLVVELKADLVALLVVFFVFFTTALLWLTGAASGIFGFRSLIVGYGFKTVGDLLLCGYGVIGNGRPELLVLFPLAEIFHVPYIIHRFAFVKHLKIVYNSSI